MKITYLTDKRLMKLFKEYHAEESNGEMAPDRRGWDFPLRQLELEIMRRMRGLPLNDTVDDHGWIIFANSDSTIKGLALDADWNETDIADYDDMFTMAPLKEGETLWSFDGDDTEYGGKRSGLAVIDDENRITRILDTYRV